MLSVNKRKEILCPHCGNSDIYKQRMYGSSSGVCLDSAGGCNRWWPWSHRLIVPVGCGEKIIKQKVKEYNNRYKKSWIKICFYWLSDRWELLVFNYRSRGIKCLFCHSMLTWTKR